MSSVSWSEWWKRDVRVSRERGDDSVAFRLMTEFARCLHDAGKTEIDFEDYIALKRRFFVLMSK